MRPLGGRVSAKFMSPALLKGFNYTGFYVGLYASSNGVSSSAYASFDNFVYAPEGDRDDWYMAK